MIDGGGGERHAGKERRGGGGRPARFWDAHRPRGTNDCAHPYAAHMRLLPWPPRMPAMRAAHPVRRIDEVRRSTCESRGSRAAHGAQNGRSPSLHTRSPPAAPSIPCPKPPSRSSPCPAACNAPRAPWCWSRS
jgi:hypothetical protein